MTHRFVALLAALAVGCYGSSPFSPDAGGGDDAHPDAVVAEIYCEPGANRVCLCGDGSSRVQTCRADGTRWRACQCAPPDGGVVGDGGEGNALACWMLTSTERQIALLEVDLRSGAWTEIGRYGDDTMEAFPTAAMAYFRGTIVTCARGGWLEIDLADGTMRRGPETRCEEGLGVHEGQLVAFCGEGPEGPCFYDDFDSLVAGLPTRRMSVDMHASRFTVHGGELFAAWHSTDVIDVYDVRTGELDRTIELEGWDTWVWGLSVADGALHLANNRAPDAESEAQHVVSFDPVTGAERGEVRFSVFPSPYIHPANGLWCESPGPELP